jgi:branched-chain amino acid transport system permease protein
MAFASQFLAVYGDLINFIGINALLALSLYVTLAAGQLSLGNAAFAAIGGYTAGILTMHVHAPFLVALAAGALLAGGVALVIGFPVLRLRGVYLAMATLAFGEVVRIAAVNLEITGGAQGLVGIPNHSRGWFIYLTLAAVCYLLARLRQSRFGWALESIREDETAAATMGIDTTLYKTFAFALGALIAGLTGGIYAHLHFLIAPRDFGFAVAVDLLVFNIVGGTRRWYGPLFGAVLLTALPEVLRGVGVTAGPLRMFVTGLILLLVILFLPNGLVSLVMPKPVPAAGDRAAVTPTRD